MRILIVGCGYVGKEVVRSAPPGTQISVLTRSQDRFDELRAIGVEPVLGHWLDGSDDSASDGSSDATATTCEWRRRPPSVDAILVAVPHREDEIAGDVGDQTHVIGLRNLERTYQAVNPNRTPPLIYLSTTGVYGQADDCEVTEETEVTPNRTGPRIAVAAEQWLKQNANWESRVLRLAGIYGPNRVPLAAKLRAGEALTVPQDGFLNLIHVSDIAQVIWQLMERPITERLYVLSDGNPVPRRDFYQCLARLCGVEEPVFDTPDPTSSRARRAGNKRVNPERIMRELDLELQFPDYQRGLRQAIGSD